MGKAPLGANSYASCAPIARGSAQSPAGTRTRERETWSAKSGVGYRSRPFEDAQKLAAARAAQELLLRRSSVAYKGRHARPATHHAARRRSV